MGNNWSYRGSNGYHNRRSGAPTVVAPAAGDTVLLTPDTWALYIDGAATLATLTVKLAPGAYDGQEVELGFGVAVTALTVEDHAGNAVSGADAAGAVGAGHTYRWLKAKNAWVHWR